MTNSNQIIYFIIDFDSTFVTIETLDALAEIALEKNRQKNKILREIQNITKDGMIGKISFDESLSQRLKLFKAKRKHIESLIKILKKKITPSIVRNKEFFRKYKDQIYIISGGFKEYIVPIFAPYGIEASHILANNFLFDKKGRITGFDKNNLLAQKGGKVKQIQTLHLDGTKYVIGDGYTDYEIKKAGLADKFFVFHENIKRESVARKADYLLPNFDEFLYLLDLPRAYSYPKHRIKILLLENISKMALSMLKKEGYEVTLVSHALSELELIEKIKDISVLGIRSATRITDKVLENSSKLLTIGAFCIGTNHIDLNKSSQRGIAVFNAPYSNTRSVVELTLGEIIMLFRNITDMNNNMHKGVWNKSSGGSYEVRGKKLGIVGYGNIGTQLSVLAESFGMDVYFYDIVDKLALGNAHKCNTLKELLKIADVVSIHVDGRPENTNLISEKEFSLMKDGVVFLNLSRGYIVDIKALYKNIKSGKVKGAAIDVYPEEPKSKEEQFISPLQNLSNVILTPHIGGSTKEAQESIGLFVADKIIKFINTGDTTMSVNFPNLQLPLLKNAHRLIHIHQNVPGVLAKINSTLATNKINIEGQYLKTNEEIGYVITDVNRSYNKEVLQKLKTIPETIKFRVLY